MNFSRNFGFRAFAVSMTLIASGFVSASTGNAVTVTPFTALYNKNINGQVVVTGNTNMTCPTTKDALGATIPTAESTACQEARVRTIKSGLNLNNNAYRMIYAGAGTYGNRSMINSSAANVTVPVGSTIKSAFLFWHGDMSKPSTADGGRAYNSGVAKGCENDATFCRNKVWLLTPKDTAAQVVTADAVSSENPTSGIYRAHADITRDLVQINDNKWTVANGQKTITVRVGDIESAQGRDTQAGWSIIVAYAHPNEDLRNVVIYGGLAKVARNDPADVALSGLQTPPTGNVTTTFGVVAAEGDASEGGDFMNLISGSTTTAIGDVANPINNPANSTISQNGAVQSFFDNTEGKYSNTFGTDADQFTLKNALPNNATTATVRMGTNLETWYPIAFTMATELYSPELQLTKIAKTLTDVDGNVGVSAGDRVEYFLYVSNISNAGTASNVVISDTLPAGLRYVSTTSGGVGCSGSGQTFTCNLGNLPALYPPSGNCGCVQFIAEVVAGSGTIPNIATASYSGPLGSLEATSNVVTLEYTKYTSDLIAVVNNDELFLEPESQSDVVIEIRNEGPSSDSNYSVNVEIPDSITAVAPLPSGCTQVGQIITCDASAGTSSDPATTNELIAGEFVQIPITVEPDADFTGGTFSVEVFSGGIGNDGDVSAANNSDSEQFVTTADPESENISRPEKNTPPTVLPIEIESVSGGALVIDVTEFLQDPEYDETEIVDFTQPSNDAGLVELSGTTFTFLPEPTFIGDTTFDFTIKDIRGKKVIAPISVSVYPSELPKSGGGSLFERFKAFVSSIFEK